ncbi:MAG: peptidase S41, partial [Lutibacter sp.]|nr:peptidase S41 [Lutibacter sp.]
DGKGTIPKFSDAGRATFKTEKGRTVYGGGGINPDVEIKNPKTTKTTEILLKSDAFFNYVTDYFYKNPSIESPLKFKLNDSDFSALKNFVIKNNEDFETDTEADFKKANETAISEYLDGSLSKTYTKLLGAIQSEKLKELDKNKSEILNKLTEEIIKRYYYNEGVYIQKTVFDNTILKAISILNNSNKYNSILKN